MAIGIHVAYIGMKPITPSGVVLDKDRATMHEMLTASSEQRVTADSALPNTAGFPTVKTYLEREASGNYVLRHLDQTYVITYNGL